MLVTVFEIDLHKQHLSYCSLISILVFKLLKEKKCTHCIASFLLRYFVANYHIQSKSILEELYCALLGHF